jgi:hypothetical protein
MGLATGLVLLILGVALVLISQPRQGEIRPWVRSPAGWAFIPAMCLALLAFGVSLIVFSL